MATIRKELTLSASPAQVWESSFQVFPGAGSGTRLVWITDLLPDALAAAFGAMIEEGSKAIQAALG